MLKSKSLTIIATMAALTSRAEIHDNDAIRAICGEAAGEPYKAKLAIACVIRNRGSLQGVYGLGASHVSHASQQTMNECKRAWLESRTNNIVGSARHFGGTIDDKYFINKLHKQPIMTIGHTRIYQ